VNRPPNERDAKAAALAAARLLSRLSGRPLAPLDPEPGK
jgi:hypothetical protein